MLKALRLSELLLPLDAQLCGSDAAFDGVSIDSRSVTAGQLFVALTGPNFDGHDYLADVVSKGAVIPYKPFPTFKPANIIGDSS